MGDIHNRCTFHRGHPQDLSEYTCVPGVARARKGGGALSNPYRYHALTRDDQGDLRQLPEEEAQLSKQITGRYTSK